MRIYSLLGLGLALSGFAIGCGLPNTASPHAGVRYSKLPGQHVVRVYEEAGVLPADISEILKRSGCADCHGTDFDNYAGISANRKVLIEKMQDGHFIEGADKERLLQYLNDPVNFP